MANEEQKRIWNDVNVPRFFLIRDALERSLAPYGLAAIDALAPKPGEAALDVGCGFGSTTRELARRVGSAGRVLGIDLSAPFVSAAVAGAPPNVRYACADAQTYRFEASFDLCLSRFGVMFFEEPAQAFANLCRALRPGGRFAAVVWASPEQNGWVEVPLRVLRRHLPVPPVFASAGPGPFSLADPAALERLLREAGFSQAYVQSLRLPYFAGATLDEAVRLLLHLGPAAAALREAGDAGERLRPAIAADLRQELRGVCGPRGVELPGTALLATATRSAPDA